jgi:hypothetical protein
MTEYRFGQSPTFSRILSVMAMSTLPLVAPTQAAAFVTRSYAPLQEQATGQLTYVESMPVSSTVELLGAMADCYRVMSETQVPLEPEIAKILHENLWSLYVED